MRTETANFAEGPIAVTRSRDTSTDNRQTFPFFPFHLAERNRPLNKGGRLLDTLPREAERWMPSGVLDRRWCINSDSKEGMLFCSDSMPTVDGFSHIAVL
jgi:hypothetical protein